MHGSVAAGSANRSNFAMNVVLQGSTAQFPPEQVLKFLAANGHTGTLEIVSRRKKAQVAFERGQAVYAVAENAGTGEAALLDLFFWDAGVFSFVPEVHVPQDVQRLPIDLEQVLAEGVRRSSEYREFRSVYPHDDVVFKVDEDPTLGDGVRLKSEELRMLVKIGQGRSIGQLCTDFRKSSLELYPMLRRLEDLHLINQVAPIELSSPGNPFASSSATARDADVVTDEKDRVPPRKAADETTKVKKLEMRSGNVAFEPGPTVPRDEPPPAAVEPPPPPPPPPPVAKPLPPPVLATAVKADLRETGIEGANVLGTLTASNGAMYPLIEERYGIGRDPSNGVALNEPSVSSFHARITRAPKGFLIEDVKSRNGTFVNGDAVKEPRLLVDADVIRVGKVLLTFSLAKPTRPPRKTAS
jgi:hypothetical protein